MSGLASWDQIVRVLSLADHNTRVVVLGTTALGTACGLIGSFMLLRKRALMADAVSHATLPGIGLAFMVMVAAGHSGKWFPGLLAGALLTGLLGMGLVLFLRHYTRINEDAALGIVLSVFFGLGVAILGLIQKMSQGSAAGLESFIYGKTASMLAADAWLIAAIGGLVLGLSGLLYKEFTLLCFDQDFAASQGWPVAWLDILLMTLVVLVTVIGLQAVGLILVIALLITPPASARFWTERLSLMTGLAALFGAAGGALGSVASALVPKLPAGAVIVLVNSSFFLVSLVFGSARGLLVRARDQWNLSRKVGHQHLMRALLEYEEATGQTTPTLEQLLVLRSWTPAYLKTLLWRAERDNFVGRRGEGVVLTEEGRAVARRILRNHRLWELYLIHYADIAPCHVDRDADQVEHVLDTATIERLQDMLLEHYPKLPSPHPLEFGT